MMWKRRGLAWATSLWLGLAASTAAQAQAAKPCLPQDEAQAVFLAVLPSIIDTASKTCAARLPAGALLRNPEPLLAKYRAEAERAWPVAVEGFVKLSGPEARPIMQGEAGKALILGVMGPMFSNMIKPDDCASADRILGYLAPLPPANTAGLFVSILDLSQKDRNKERFPICPLAR